MKTQDGIIVGNVEDKSSLSNPISRALVRGFDSAVTDLVTGLEPDSLHEVGCGEGRLTLMLDQLLGIPIRASELSFDINERNQLLKTNEVTFVQKSIYELEEGVDSADVVMCCEVLEHLEEPVSALAALRRLGARAYVLTVPREPIWRLMNMCRGKYLNDLGNTPGHLQNWSTSGFVKLLQGSGFVVTTVRTPLPWTAVVAETDATT